MGLAPYFCKPTSARLRCRFHTGASQKGAPGDAGDIVLGIRRGVWRFYQGLSRDDHEKTP